ncbi:beta/alpha barrel domain-containing protein [Chitinophaga rhizophila]|uniref:Bifunctional 4-hydroxy-2-oxoglutarate aldolase/2-dehydro-3-deoxy-phosphogluconate aldolase n=1 Tax=Chitinophaga rhizophila TaxID=2866212 RepID=A0ABS7GD40_9BACT|nr:bifunctional 4-hydroxy-2-oxoglutarate aldolase/2-dehydro-3-deoxy-phosphogluconate aldolase [Chitinophaga rhizophila]MBW8685341.1 bifunctional 4-hydroxy-2-oxoglutarate aldolase/2-dehydro-3-deoxy-phosphogluconate aldolase [Chitinophaga rhizophila]
MAVPAAEIIAAFERSKAIPVFYHDDAEVCIQVLQACYDAGIRVFEFTNRGANAKRNFSAMRAHKLSAMPDMYLGIGTIKVAEDVTVFAGEGADFIVSPIIDTAVAERCSEKNIVWIPGCMTPSEIAVAERYEAPLTKLFPGNVLGPGFVKAIKPLFPKMKFMPTGGVEPTKESIKSWLDAGVVCVGMGSNLLNKELIDRKDWAALKTQLTSLVKLIQEVS